jgi:hypothetical protein
MDFIKRLKQEKTVLESRLQYINKLLDTYGEPVDNGLSQTEATKRKLMEGLEGAYRINDLLEMLKIQGMDIGRSVVHQALKQLREAGDVLAFRLNGSNQQVYYMMSTGRGSGSYPVKSEYQPVDEQYVEKFEWLD